MWRAHGLVPHAWALGQCWHPSGVSARQCRQCCMHHSLAHAPWTLWQLSAFLDISAEQLALQMALLQCLSSTQLHTFFGNQRTVGDLPCWFPWRKGPSDRCITSCSALTRVSDVIAPLLL